MDTQKHDWSKFDEYRIETEMNGTLSAVLAVFRDYDSYPQLFDGFDEIVNHVDETKHVTSIISRLKLPFLREIEMEYISMRLNMMLRSNYCISMCLARMNTMSHPKNSYR